MLRMSALARYKALEMGTQRLDLAQSRVQPHGDPMSGAFQSRVPAATPAAHSLVRHGPTRSITPAAVAIAKSAASAAQRAPQHRLANRRGAVEESSRTRRWDGSKASQS